MALATLNDIPVVSARLSVPRLGVWHATLVVDSDVRLAGNAVFVLNGVGWAGHIRRSGAEDGECRVLLVGGAGGLGKTSVAAKSYKSTTARLVATDILQVARETLSGRCDSTAIGYALNWWATVQSTAGAALSTLVGHLRWALGADVSWRILRDGTVWLGQEAWPASGLELEAEETDATGLRYSVPLEPRLQPGTTVNGDKVSYVEHILSARELSTHVYLEAS